MLTDQQQDRITRAAHKAYQDLRKLQHTGYIGIALAQIAASQMDEASDADFETFVKNVANAAREYRRVAKKMQEVVQ